ncbi:MAG: hypothetical protein IPK50_08805 [Fibrobacterota bacterium]|nr:hypothetical protein [Fibrobacterota bacterium]QQS06981.1 MAG: hypothetical protein IPK50_08805 [Fibrobacterota bacterium]
MNRESIDQNNLRKSFAKLWGTTVSSGSSSLPRIIGFLGWLLLLWNFFPGTPKDVIKEVLRERDDQLHGELWDLHYCMGDTGRTEAQISYPEPTLILGYDTSHISAVRRSVPHPESTVIRHLINEEEKKQHKGDSSWKPKIVSIYDTLNPDTTILEIKPRLKFLPGRGTILHAGSTGPFSPPGNIPSDNWNKGNCSGRIGARGYFPDSLRVEITRHKDTLSTHLITGIKQMAPKKGKATNRTRITVIFYPPARYEIQVSERPRYDQYSCSYSGLTPIDCAEESMLSLLQNGLIK